MRNKPSNQKGVTLVELLIVISIAALVVGAAVAVWLQLDSVSDRNSDDVVAYAQVQNAGDWFSRDALQITQEPTFGGGNLVTLEWDEYGDNPPHHVVVYTLEGAGTFKELRRNYSINGTSQENSIVAQDIDSTNTSCEWNDPVEKDTLVLEITAQVGERIASRTYKVEPRAFSE